MIFFIQSVSCCVKIKNSEQRLEQNPLCFSESQIEPRTIKEPSVDSFGVLSASQPRSVSWIIISDLKRYTECFTPKSHFSSAAGAEEQHRVSGHEANVQNNLSKLVGAAPEARFSELLDPTRHFILCYCRRSARLSSL